VTPANIPTKLRSSGIISVGDVPWGTHFCHFYETPKDLLDILIPYFKAGLENNEFCMWIVCDPIAEADGHRALRNAVPEFDRRLAAGDIEIVPHSQWCLREGIFDGERVIAGWKEKLGRAQADGYAGMRVNGNTAWVTGGDWTDFARCECEFSRMIATERMLLLCAYPLPARSASISLMRHARMNSRSPSGTEAGRLWIPGSEMPKRNSGHIPNNSKTA